MDRSQRIVSAGQLVQPTCQSLIHAVSASAVCCRLGTTLGLSIEKIKSQCPVELMSQCVDSDNTACSPDSMHFTFIAMLEDSHHDEPTL